MDIAIHQFGRLPWLPKAQFIDTIASTIDESAHISCLIPNF
jgi:hypothetical protein